MTIRIELECDGDGCNQGTEINDYTEADVKHAGYSVDARYGGHYCKKCWPKVEAEMKEEG